MTDSVAEFSTSEGSQVADGINEKRHVGGILLVVLLVYPVDRVSTSNPTTKARPT